MKPREIEMKIFTQSCFLPWQSKDREGDCASSPFAAFDPENNSLADGLGLVHKIPGTPLLAEEK